MMQKECTCEHPLEKHNKYVGCLAGKKDEYCSCKYRSTQ